MEIHDPCGGRATTRSCRQRASPTRALLLVVERFIPLELALHCRHSYGDSRASARPRARLERPADRFRALAHGDQAITGAIGISAFANADAIVFDGEFDLAVAE